MQLLEHRHRLQQPTNLSYWLPPAALFREAIRIQHHTGTGYSLRFNGTFHSILLFLELFVVLEVVCLCFTRYCS